MEGAVGVERRVGGDPAFAALLTVRAASREAAMSVLGFLEPGWGVSVQPRTVAGELRVLVQVGDEGALQRLRQAASRKPRVIGCVDRLWLMAAGGRVQVRTRPPVRSKEDLALVCPPGTGRRAREIVARPEAARDVTGRPNRVAVVTDGTAAWGLGSVGPPAALPIIEAKAALLAQLADIDAVPICLDVHGADAVISAVRALGPAFGGIDLEDIAAPACFDIERRLRDALDIPVLHADQQGIAVVVLAGLRNALHLVGKRLDTARVVVIGVGAAGPAVSRLLRHAGARDVAVWAPDGVLDPGTPDGLPGPRDGLAEQVGPRRLRGRLAQALTGADAVIDVGRGGLLTAHLVATMAARPVVFALAYPEPEIRPEQLAGAGVVYAIGRHDGPNPLDTMLALPGLLRGALNTRAPRITTAMLLAAADVLAGMVGAELVSPHRLLPDLLDPQLVPTMSAAVAAVEAARRRAAENPGRGRQAR